MLSGRRLKVGVTIYVRDGQQSLWENGIFQNCFFLIMLLRRSPLVEAAYLVNGGNGRVENATDFLALAPAPVIDLETATEKLDVLIELSAQVSPEWARNFRARGGRVVGMKVANDYVIDIERMMFDKPNGMIISGTPYDALWTLPAFERTCASYYETAHRAPVRAMQHLWSPVLLERSMKVSSNKYEFGYVPGRRRWRLSTFEPNICMVKTSFIPMLIADLAHRQDPVMIEYLRVYNTFQFTKNPDFVALCRSLDLVRHGIATFEARFALYEIMALQTDAVVAHHWENAQNYAYYEVLYGGYPLIHNSDLLEGCGYRYTDFDCHEGALALRQAFAEHDARLPDYRAQVSRLIEVLDPESARNVEDYSAALAELFTEGR